MKNLILSISIAFNLVLAVLCVFILLGSKVATDGEREEALGLWQKVEKLESIVLSQYKTIDSLPSNLVITRAELDDNNTGYIEIQTEKGYIYFNVVEGSLIELQ